MADKIMFETKDTSIAIVKDKLYIVSNKYEDYSIKAIMIIPGFQIEIGRNLSDIKKALAETRVPAFFKQVISKGNRSIYSIVRMYTGKVDDKVVANIACIDGKITSVSFNKELLTDSNYRRYNNLSVFHQLSLPYSLSGTDYTSRGEQVRQLVKVVISRAVEVEVIEGKNKVEAVVSDDEGRIKLLFILNEKTDRYELISISEA